MVTAQIIGILNIETGRRFRPCPAYDKLIKARIREGATIDDFKIVIHNKVKAWKNDPKYSKYLRPETLFGTHFQAYLNEDPEHLDGRERHGNFDPNEAFEIALRRSYVKGGK